MSQDIYPSRVKAHPEKIERKDPVVYNSAKSSEAIAAEEVEFFEKNGFLIYNKLFDSNEVDELNSAFENMCQDESINDRQEFIKEPDSDIVRSIFSVHKLNDVYKKLTDDPRVRDKVNFLLDDETYIHQARINAKPGFKGKDFYWHSDFETWHVEDGMPRMRAISCLITLTDNKLFNGSLMVMPGTHKSFVSCVGATPDEHFKDSLRKQEYGVPDEGSLTEFYEKNGIKICECEPGSVILFDCNLMHGSSSNISPLPRRNAFFVLNAVSNRLEEPFGGTKPRPNYIAERTTELELI